MPRKGQLGFDLKPVYKWGGRRTGAGRPRTSHRVGHLRRPFLDGENQPVHVTWRAMADLPSLRTLSVARAIRDAIAGGHKEWFRVVHFTIQADHLHLIVEATNRMRLARGLQGLGVRIWRRVNAALGRRGSVFSDRYHARALSTPREARNAIRYVLLNHRKHGRDAHAIDRFSSARWFDGWREPIPAARAENPTLAAKTWLLATGWRRHGLLGAHERPGEPGSGDARGAPVERGRPVAPNLPN